MTDLDPTDQIEIRLHALELAVKVAIAPDITYPQTPVGFTLRTAQQFADWIERGRTADE